MWQLCEYLIYGFKYNYGPQFQLQSQYQIFWYFVIASRCNYDNIIRILLQLSVMYRFFDSCDHNHNLKLWFTYKFHIIYLDCYWYIACVLQMCAEFQVLSPLVSTRETHFLRYCQQNAEEGTWAIVDFPVDSFHQNFHPSYPRYCRRSSGCVIQDMPNGYSRVSPISEVFLICYVFQFLQTWCF